ncbi:MAG: efflux RND transporter permease subunit [Betaproteobacteria bacterium]|nr:efflux RND transporter permease subunit [Betaproteobacteria bacterium]
MNFTGWLQTHRRSILFLLTILAVGGVIAAFVLPVTLFPDVSFPRVAVELNSGDRTADQMVALVTRPVEEAIRLVPGVRTVGSTSSRGSAEIKVDFGWGRDMAAATLQVNSAVTQILPTLPAGTTVETKRMDPTVDPVISYSLSSDTLSLTQLYDLAQYQLRPLLSSVKGVAKIGITGGAPEEYRVTVDPAKLSQFGLTLTDVSNALAQGNVQQAVGHIEDHYQLYLVVADSRYQTFAQIASTVLRTGPNGLVRLGEVATVTDAVVPQFIRVTADGHDAVLMDVFQQPDGNSVQIAKDIKTQLKTYASILPPGVKLATWYDQSVLVTDSAKSVRDAILIGIVLAAVVLFVFLRNYKITIISILVVPTVLATTITLLSLFGMGFNIMTLGGMAAAVGLIIDDAVVMIEHIMRRLRGAPGQHHGRVMMAAREFFQPLVGSSAATIIIFFPLAFLTGVTGAFFKALSLTMAGALVISFIITWLAVPILADHWLNEKDASHEDVGPLTRRFHRGYEWIMRRTLRRPALVLIGIVPLLAIGYLAYRHVGSGFMPHEDEGGFVLDYISPPGTSLTETDRMLREVERIIHANPNVLTYSRRTGAQLGGGVTEANTGDFFIRLKPFPRDPIDDVMSQVSDAVQAAVPTLDIDTAQLMEDLIGDLTEVPQPIQIKIFSDDPAQLGTVAQNAADAIAKVKGVVGVRSGVTPAGDALNIEIDRTKAAELGFNVNDLTTLIDGYLEGNVSTQILQGPKTIGVRLWVPSGLRSNTTKLENLLLRAPTGQLFPLKAVAKVVVENGQPEITRENLKRMASVTARIEGRDLGSTSRDVKAVMDKPGLLPAGVYYTQGGLYEQQQLAFAGLAMVFAGAVALVFLLLLFLYERFQIAISIMIIPLMAMAAVFVGLFVTHTELNITAIMGMTMIVGMVTEIAIFYFSEYREIVGDMDHTEALIAAGKNRMRPITMTTLAAILTLLPLAFAIGQGSQMQQPLAIAIISGLIVALPLVLLVMPVLFDLFTRRRSRPAPPPASAPTH